ncbi:uncharacterized protein EV422DRAFT_536527 [Fimicolochytrium jonesii]|uniref:uncharacterized protein n=1 Tax=Fimicolochytrium jonesii TaxID=1396493 RepID=UPI0022FE202C|nr:uncharacterized protein EV422DRAFT_536527 [Fimicolochytrium jonesii]KAI8818692.1 hypothetical protein EV422DRAFT_536527 [Fimicolochytrium jonesii]
MWPTWTSSGIQYQKREETQNIPEPASVEMADPLNDDFLNDSSPLDMRSGQTPKTPLERQQFDRSSQSRPPTSRIFSREIADKPPLHPYDDLYTMPPSSSTPPPKQSISLKQKSSPARLFVAPVKSFGDWMKDRGRVPNTKTKEAVPAGDDVQAKTASEGTAVDRVRKEEKTEPAALPPPPIDERVPSPPSVVHSAESPHDTLEIKREQTMSPPSVALAAEPNHTPTAATMKLDDTPEPEPEPAPQKARISPTFPYPNEEALIPQSPINAMPKPQRQQSSSAKIKTEPVGEKWTAGQPSPCVNPSPSKPALGSAAIARDSPTMMSPGFLHGTAPPNSYKTVDDSALESGHTFTKKTANVPARPQSAYGILTPVKPAAMDPKAIADFDPLQKNTSENDWFLKWDSPQAVPPAAVPQSSRTPAKQRSMGNLTSPPPSLLDSVIECPTPRSIPRYSEKDVQEKIRILREKYESQFEIVRASILQEAKDEHDRRWNKLNEDWEQFKDHVNELRKTELENAQMEYERLYTQMKTVYDDKQRLAKENELWEVKNKQLQMDVTDMRESTKKLMAQIDSLKEDLSGAEGRYTHLREYANQKLEEANTELGRMQDEHEQEVSTLKAKSMRQEVQMRTLQRSLESKEAENSQLSSIVDNLVMRLERK